MRFTPEELQIMVAGLRRQSWWSEARAKELEAKGDRSGAMQESAFAHILAGISNKLEEAYPGDMKKLILPPSLRN